MSPLFVGAMVGGTLGAMVGGILFAGLVSFFHNAPFEMVGFVYGAGALAIFGGSAMGTFIGFVSALVIA